MDENRSWDNEIDQSRNEQDPQAENAWGGRSKSVDATSGENWDDWAQRNAALSRSQIAASNEQRANTQAQSHGGTWDTWDAPVDETRSTRPSDAIRKAQEELRNLDAPTIETEPLGDGFATPVSTHDPTRERAEALRREREAIAQMAAEEQRRRARENESAQQTAEEQLRREKEALAALAAEEKRAAKESARQAGQDEAEEAQGSARRTRKLGGGAAEEDKDQSTRTDPEIPRYRSKYAPPPPRPAEQEEDQGEYRARSREELRRERRARAVVADFDSEEPFDEPMTPEEANRARVERAKSLGQRVTATPGARRTTVSSEAPTRGTSQTSRTSRTPDPRKYIASKQGGGQGKKPELNIAGIDLSNETVRRVLYAIACVIVASLIVLAISNCSNQGSEAESGAVETQENAQANNSEDANSQAVSDKISSMTTEQKVAQLFMVRPESITGVDVATMAGDSTKEAIEKYPVGGIIYFADNLQDSSQTKDMLANTNQYSQDTIGLPMFLGVDEEGGDIARVASNSAFNVDNVDTARKIGETNDTQNAKDAASTIGGYLAELGFNVNFAPDADIVPNEDNVLYSRSYGSDAQTASDMVGAAIEGYEEAGILSSAKHFPGIGDLEGDTETASVTSIDGVDVLKQGNLIPFQTAIEKNVPFIMIGHVSYPEISGDKTPASLSSEVVTDLLRNDMGYDGIIITDSLAMGAITGSYSSEDAAVGALKAGVDIILMPDDFEKAYDAVLSAVKSGEISEERVNESLTRIIGAKLAMQQ